MNMPPNPAVEKDARGKGALATYFHSLDCPNGGLWI
jgi:hypothetical protein